MLWCLPSRVSRTLGTPSRYIVRSEIVTITAHIVTVSGCSAHHRHRDTHGLPSQFGTAQQARFSISVRTPYNSASESETGLTPGGRRTTVLLPNTSRRNVLTGSVPSATRTCSCVVCVAGKSVCAPVVDRMGFGNLIAVFLTGRY